ncbi:protoporphyrinogen oxidase [Streptomyces sp. NBC_00083]|uniref:protoporphyrinogen oxidase n=1 Tax=Streptomyces sp. NBC_00083 TaxID=2975647 RepID=UPI002259CE07|nr:protoporphyrinogen oxidase [Streptomyces sp. NBC_00083]MCX5385508.1 protoporphyrinogen oxidase [Streptomyces sp. NBC_00083]
MRSTRSVIVIGGGISGLAAAWQLRGRADVTVLESEARIGGKLRTGTLAGVPVDEGAESVMALRPEAVDLATAVGLGPALTDPAPAPVTVWTRGALRAMPAGHMLGIPSDPAALAGTGLLSDEGLARLRDEPERPAGPITEDVAISDYLIGRIGREAVDRLVEPLLGGVYAGRTDRLSLRSAMPGVARVAERGEPLLAALRGRPRPRGSLVRGIAGGTGRLPLAVAAESGARVLTGTTVRAVERTASGGWRVQAATADGPLLLGADAVILAVPAFAAATLLRPLAPDAHIGLSAIPYASTAVVTMAFARERSGLAGLPTGNGFLVPPVDGHTVKAATFLSNKWDWQAKAAPGHFLLRASVGRAGEEHLLERTDRHLVRAALHDLHHAVGAIGEPVAARVTRWDRGLPQYTVGHAERTARIREDLARLSGLAVCGAAYEGVGIAACVATGLAAALRVSEG